MKLSLKLKLILLACLGAAAVPAGDFPLHEARLKQVRPEGDSRDYLLEIDAALPAQGYRIETGDDTVRIYGGDLRGLYYGVNALAGGVEAKTASPEWLYRYASDYQSVAYPNYMDLADRSISGYAWQWRQEWRDFQPENPSDFAQFATLQDSLDEIRKAYDTGLIDFMLVIHIYAVSGQRNSPWFDCSNPQDIADLAERCRLAASHGIRHIMICADDWTPREEGRYVAPNAGEREYFDDSVGRAHGTLMAELYQVLHPEFPELELSLVPPVYSVNDHRSYDPAGEEYLRDFDQSAPREVYLVWTGPEVISERIAKEDYQRFTQAMTSGRKLAFWDNSECFDIPLPVWQTEFYPGAAADHDGIIFLNAHTFGWHWVAPFIGDANDYLWDAASYDWRASWHKHVADLFGETVADRMLEWRDMLMEARQAMADGDVELQRQLLADLEKRLDVLRPTPHFGYAFLDNALSAIRDRLDITAREVEIPLLTDQSEFPSKAVRFDLVRDNGDETAPELATHVAAAFVGDDLCLQIVSEQPGLADIQEPLVMKKRDDAVYNHPEAIELFIQPGAATGYGHFVFDPWGNRYDAFQADGPDSWNPDWQVDIVPVDGGWQALVTIPVTEFEQVGLTRPAAGVIWRFNMMRMPPGQKPSVFAPTRNYGFHTPEFFGVLKVKP